MKKEEKLQEEKLVKLVCFNKKMGFIHLAQAIFMLIFALSFDRAVAFKPAIMSNFLTYNQTIGKLITNPETIFNLPFAVFVSVFLFLSAAFHFVVASKRFKNKYMEGLKKKINVFRWYEYSLSSSIMIVLIAVLFGVYDIGALMLIFGLNASMNLFGLLMEKMNQKNDKVDWTAFIYGSIAGIIPWIVIILYAFGNSNPSEIPWFVYAIFGSYLVFFNCFPINMILQYKKIGKWQDYLYGERAYILLSLVAKTILAWLVFFGIMQP